MVVAAAGVTGPAWLLVADLAGHGFKDLWQHRHQYVANTRWWPPFCLVVDWVAAAVLVVLIVAGVDFCVSSSDLAPLVVMNLGSSVPTSPGMGQWRADGW